MPAGLAPAGLSAAGLSSAGLSSAGYEEVVADKGYHSNDVLTALEESEVRSYIPEPARGRRNWEDKKAERDAVYRNRRRVKRSK